MCVYYVPQSARKTEVWIRSTTADINSSIGETNYDFLSVGKYHAVY